jgi:hypothetical protein
MGSVGEGTPGWVMLFAYVDESFEHDKATGDVVQATLGGCIASEDAWKLFEPEWAAALPPGMDMFHMTDFEARKDMCRDWEKKRRDELLNKLLDFMGRHVTQFFGFTVGVAGEKLNRPLRSGYRDGLVSAIFEITGVAKHLGEEKIAMVFAGQPEFKLNRILNVLEEIDHSDTRLISATVANPVSVNQLQAADIVAYETSRFHRNTEATLLEARYPLRQLGSYEKGMALEWSLKTQEEQGIDPHLRFSARDAFARIRSSEN